MKKLLLITILFTCFSCKSAVDNVTQKKSFTNNVDLNNRVSRLEKENYLFKERFKDLVVKFEEVSEKQQQILAEIEKLKNNTVNSDNTGNNEASYPTPVNPNNIDWSLEPYSLPDENNAFPAYLTPFNDATTGAEITRIADATAFGQSGSVTQHNYSSKAVWNANGSLMMLSDQNARILDASDFSVVYTVNLPGSECWSSIDPLKIYGVQNGNQFVSMNVTTGTRTVLRTFTGYTNLDIGKGEGRIDQQDKYICFTANKDSSEWLIVYNVQTNTIVAELAQPSGNLDFASISDSGNYVYVSWADHGTAANQGFKVYDYDLTNYRHVWNYTEHGDCGVDQDGNEVFVQFRDASLSLGNTQRYLEMIQLNDGTVTGLYYDTDNPSPRGVWGGHISCRNVERPGWAYIGEGMASNDVMANEIFAVKLSKTENLVERYGKHHSNRVAGGYNHENHLCVNRDGTQMIFKSNFNNATIKALSHAPSFVLKWPQD